MTALPLEMRPPSPSSSRLQLRRHGGILAVAAIVCVLLLAMRGRSPPPRPDGRQKPHDRAPHEELDADEEEPAGWADSFLHHQADAELTRLLDAASQRSPLVRCAADAHVLKLSGQQLEEVNHLFADEEEDKQQPVLTATAERMPCGKKAAPDGKAACCSHPIHFRLGTTDFNVFQQVFQKHYMRYLYALFVDQPPRYVLDAGANAGFSSALFKLLWPNATVVSLEPDPGNFAMLEANTQQFDDVHALRAGLWGHRANITMTGNHGNWGRVFREAEKGEMGMPAYGVQDLADMLNIPAFDFVKIDIEGAEGMVFEPGGDFAWISRARAVSLEIHDYFAGYFGLKEVSTRVDAAFNSTRYSLVSDNEHVMYLAPPLAKALRATQQQPGEAQPEAKKGAAPQDGDNDEGR